MDGALGMEPGRSVSVPGNGGYGLRGGGRAVVRDGFDRHIDRGDAGKRVQANA